MGEDKVDAIAFEMGKGADDTVRGDDRLVNNHEGLESRGIHDVRLQTEGGVHDQGGAREVEDERCVWVEGHGVSEGGDGGPRGWSIVKGVVGRVGEECDIACRIL